MSILDSVAAKIDSGEITGTQVAQDGWTAYQVHRLLNEAVSKFSLARGPVTPQYVYNLAKNGNIDGIKGPVTGRRFDDETVQAFVERWVARNLPTSN
jgi:hypothetical protein